MDQEERKMLERLLALSETNNRILRKLHREYLIRRFSRIVYIILILGISIASYYFIQPYLENLDSAFNMVNQFKSLTN